MPSERALSSKANTSSMVGASGNPDIEHGAGSTATALVTSPSFDSTQGLDVSDCRAGAAGAWVCPAG